MRIPRATLVTPELARLAVHCEALDRARKLAGWIGPGKSLTARGVLRPADAERACQLLKIQTRGQRLRSALDCDELMADWAAAVDAGFVEVSGRRAFAGEVLTDDLDPELALAGWLTAATRAFGLPGEPCAACLTVLLELARADRPIPTDELTVAVATALGDDDPDDGGAEPCPGCGERHAPTDDLDFGDLFGEEIFFDDTDPGDDEDEESAEEHTAASIAHLITFGAAEIAGAGEVRLTPLGEMLSTSIFEGAAPAPDASAGTLIEAIREVPPSIARTLAGPWLSARSQQSAGRALLAFAQTAAGEPRLAALALCGDLGPGAASAWRDWADQPGFGAYARQWLAAHGELVTEDPRDDAWLAADVLSVMLGSVPVELPPPFLAAVLREQLGDQADEALSMLLESGHPDTAMIAAAFGGIRPPQTPVSPVTNGTARPRRDMAAARSRDGEAFQVKISLLGVSKPPVWRRVVIPAGIVLDDLHEVILSAFGWSGGHLHVFSDGLREYGAPDSELGHVGEASVQLSELLVAPGDKIGYTYDFGDDWEHEIVLEKVLAVDQLPDVPGGNAGMPACLAGKGACPPEDCGGPWGYAALKRTLADTDDEEHQEMLDWLGLESAADFDPAEFSAEAATARLRHRQATGS